MSAYCHQCEDYGLPPRRALYRVTGRTYETLYCAGHGAYYLTAYGRECYAIDETGKPLTGTPLVRWEVPATGHRATSRGFHDVRLCWLAFCFAASVGNNAARSAIGRLLIEREESLGNVR